MIEIFKEFFRINFDELIILAKYATFWQIAVLLISSGYMLYSLIHKSSLKALKHNEDQLGSERRELALLKERISAKIVEQKDGAEGRIIIFGDLIIATGSLNENSTIPKEEDNEREVKNGR